MIPARAAAKVDYHPGVLEESYVLMTPLKTPAWKSTVKETRVCLKPFESVRKTGIWQRIREPLLLCALNKGLRGKCRTYRCL